MARVLLSPATVLLSAMLVASQANAPIVKTPVSRTERCNLLNHQLQKVLKSNPAAKQADAAEALQKKAVRLCANRKQAQGILALANALKLLGVKPIDTDR